MLKTVIIEDEHGACELLRDLLGGFDFIELLGEADGVKSGEELIRKMNPDLVLLDINLRDGTAFELLERFDKIDFKLIFITGYEKFALNAIKYSALDYLLKPIDTNELEAALRKAALSMEADNLSLKLNALFNNFRQIEKGMGKIVLYTSNSVYLLNVNDILRCQSEGRNTHFYLLNQDIIKATKPMKFYDELLSSNNFIRVHNSHLVNLNHVYRFDKIGQSMLVMHDKSMVPVSNSRKHLLLERLKHL